MDTKQKVADPPGRLFGLRTACGDVPVWEEGDFAVTRREGAHLGERRVTFSVYRRGETWAGSRNPAPGVLKDVVSVTANLVRRKVTESTWIPDRHPGADRPLAIAHALARRELPEGVLT